MENLKPDRKGWHEYFLDLACKIAERSTCLSRNVGAIAVKDRRILATGYNGNMTGAKHCETCLRKNQHGKNLEVCRAIHAEENVICQAAQFGISIKHATIYSTNKPCSGCFKKLVNTGIDTIIYSHDYADPLTDALIKEARFNHGKGVARSGFIYYAIRRIF